MKLVYHPLLEQVYAPDPAAKAGRMESILREVSPYFGLATPEPAPEEDLKSVHSYRHIEDIKRMGLTYQVSLLAAGGAIKAAELACTGEPAFALVRPPGHHASADHCWGFCFFNNMAISIARLRKDGKIKRAAILDIDLHFGDGTASIFENTPNVAYSHPEGSDRKEFMDNVSRFLAHTEADIIAVSAGFDRHEHDWGRLLKTEDYGTIGELVKECAEKVCQGRRYGVLEGGYNHDVLGLNVRSLLQGMS
jgi:acetoin utilization deacetylase AcuC-like enzyme